MRFVFSLLNATLWFLLGASTVLMVQHVRSHKPIPKPDKPAIVIRGTPLPPLPKSVEPPVIEIPVVTPDPIIKRAPLPPADPQPRRSRFSKR